MSIYIISTQQTKKNVVLYYVDNFVYWYTSKALENGLWTIYERDSM